MQKNFSKQEIEKIYKSGIQDDQNALNVTGKKRTFLQQRAEKKFHKIIVNHPDNPFGYRGMALLLQHQNKLNDALKNVFYAYNLNKKDSSIYLYIGNIYKAKKDFKSACVFYRKAMRNKNLRTSALINITFLYFEQGSKSQARRYATRAINNIRKTKGSLFGSFIQKLNEVKMLTQQTKD